VPTNGSPRRLAISLKLKLSLLITSLVVLAVGLVGVFLLQQQQRGLAAEMTKRGLTMAENLASGAKSSLLTDDHLSLNVLVKDALKDPDVAYVVITDQDGTVQAHSDVTLIGAPLERPAGLGTVGGTLTIRTYGAPGHGNVVDFAVPLAFGGVDVGALYLGVSQQSIELALRQTRNRVLGITLLMVLVGVCGAIALATLLSRPIFRLVNATRSIAAGDFRVALPVTSRDEIGTLTDAFNQMARSLLEKEMIKRAFTRYVAREVVDEILKDPERLVLTGERREVTVLFCDIRGFTRLSERLGPEEVVILLNQFYTLMIETTFKHDGTLDKFLGDGVMCIFGAPISHANDALQAVRTAVAMQDAVRALSDRRVAEGRDPITAGIGVSAGEVVAGTFGTEDRMEYTVIGDSVNVASRLESQAKPGQILLSAQTWDRVRDDVAARSLGMIHVRGKEQEIEVLEVLACR
jgi:adenylate cyclase